MQQVRGHIRLQNVKNCVYDRPTFSRAPDSRGGSDGSATALF